MIRRIKDSFKVLVGLSDLLSDSDRGAVRILEEEMGHHTSANQKRCINKNGDDLPWFTYPAIEYLSQLNLKDKLMLEWGSGGSSVFFSKRIKQLTSIEHNQEWYKTIKSKKLKNHQIFFKQQHEYATFPLELATKFDIIVVDGIERENCVKTAINLLTSNGLIILDNSERHPDLCQVLRENDFIEIDMHGFGPINQYTWTTSLFLRKNFDFAPLERQPQIPIGGGY